MNKLIYFLPIFILFSCSKPEGEGGAAKITGKIIMDNYSNSGTYIATFEAQDYDVYIVYGANDNIIDDRVRTSYDGTFEFPYLREGSYQVFVYSKCFSCLGGQDSVVSISTTIDSKKATVDLGEIVVNG